MQIRLVRLEIGTPLLARKAVTTVITATLQIAYFPSFFAAKQAATRFYLFLRRMIELQSSALGGVMKRFHPFVYFGALAAALAGASGCSSSSTPAVGPTPAAAIQHIVIMMQENRSFNNMFA